MAKTRNLGKKEIIESIAKDMSMSFPDVEHVVNEVFGVITQSLIDGRQVRLTGFGAFTPQYQPPRTARNPSTGESLEVDEKISVRFKPFASLSSRVNEGAFS